MRRKIFVITICSALFSFIGIFLIFFYGNTNKYDGVVPAYRIEAHKRDKTLYYPKYYYEVDGKEYTCSTGTGSFIKPNEKKNKVFYEKANPENCMTEYDKSTSKAFGIVFLVATVVVIVLAIINPQPTRRRRRYRERDATELDININKAMDVVKNIELTYKRIILGIIIIIILILLAIDSIIIKQTIKAKDYIYTTASLVSLKEEDTVFDDYIYEFEDEQDKHIEITFGVSHGETPPDTIKIKYNEKNPDDYYEKQVLASKGDIIWFIVKIVIAVLLIIVFFNKKILNKIRLSVGARR